MRHFAASIISMSIAANNHKTLNKVIILNMTTMLLILPGACIAFI